MKYKFIDDPDFYSVRRALYKKELRTGGFNKKKNEDVVNEDRDGDGVDDNQEDDD